MLDYGAEIVIIATGCHFATDGLNAATHEPIEGADASLDWQMTPDEVVAGTKAIGKRVLVLENEGYFMGVVDRPEARRRGPRGAARDAGGRHRPLHGLHARGADAPSRPRSASASASTPTRCSRRSSPASATATTSGTRPTRSTSRSTRSCCARHGSPMTSSTASSRPTRRGSRRRASRRLYVIGDASAPRMIVDSIFDGHRLAREIDSPHPEMPLPFIRERRLWGESDQRRLPGAAAQHRRCRLGPRSRGRREDRRPGQAGGGARRRVRAARRRLGRRSRLPRVRSQRVGRVLARGGAAAARGRPARARWSWSRSATTRPRRPCSAVSRSGADRARAGLG